MKTIRKIIKSLSSKILWLIFLAATINLSAQNYTISITSPVTVGDIETYEVLDEYGNPPSTSYYYDWYVDGGLITATNDNYYDDYGITSIEVEWDTVGSSNSVYVYIFDGNAVDFDLFYIIDVQPVYLYWYPDSDGDTYGDYYSQATITTIDTAPFPGAVKNNLDYCPEDASSQNNGCEEVPENMNWITSKAYDINGTLKAASKAYFNDLGKGIQSQSVDIKTSKIWASQTMYDTQGRPALSTLSAPTNNSSSVLAYNPDFIENDSDNTYTLGDYENTPGNPEKVGHNLGTLGWYYSSNNSSETTQDVTEYPFARTIYSELNPGAALKTIGGNKQDGEWKQGYTFSMPAGDELSQSGAFNDPSYKTSDGSRKIIKTVSRDVHNREAVMFTDTDGKTLAAARVGGTATRNTIISIGEQGFVDVHVPDGVTDGFTINDVSGINTEVYDLITEQPTTVATNTLDPGFYRISITNLEHYNPDTNPVTITCKENYYDYSLNDYDEAGRLIESYQPVGGTKAQKPVSTYTYNALGQLLSTTSPDEGTANFKYRKDGQIRFSQNSKQLAASPEEFSYTNYDDLGRPVESGVATGSFSALNADTSTVTTSIAAEKQETTYDGLVDANTDNIPDELYTLLGSSMVQNYIPTFLAGNVAKTHNDNTTTYYSYDVYGRVKWIVQNITGLGVKTIDYEYDPITGQVNRVLFQKNQSDQFIHRYTYDSVDNSLLKVETSTNGSTYTTHADYEYYETGALKRVELAPYQNTGDPLQSIDYVYNLNGQLKAINPTGTIQSGDKGDLFSMQIDYHGDDYSRTVTGISTPTYGQDQFNGNIKGIRWNNKELEGGSTTTDQTYSYYYNKNNWLTDAVYGQYAPAGTGTKINIIDNETHENVTKNFDAKKSITWLPGFYAKPGTGQEVTAKIITGTTSVEQSGDYNVFDITYDANGNIRTLNRNKNTSGNDNKMDQLSYVYNPNKPNQLKRVDDAAGDVAGANDIGDQTGAENYVYNEIGQLIENKEENIEYIYNASGLVTEVKQGGFARVKFFYNDKGHRVKKEAYISGQTTLDYTEYYVRDAAGTAMAIYRSGAPTEYTIYGASRLGVYKAGNSVYQLTDHLGNVRAVAQWNGTNAEAIVATDYYPFGMPMPNRNVEGGYRYGYQGEYAEKEPELEGSVNSFQLRLWDSRIGRWLSPDPYGEFHSPYLGMANNPISTVDPDGGCTDCSVCPDQCSQLGLNSIESGMAIWYGDDGYFLDALNVNYGGATYLDEINLNYSKSIGRYLPEKINFNTMNYNQIVNLSVDWFELIHEVGERNNGKPFNVLDFVDKGSLDKVQGDEIYQFFGSMSVSPIETTHWRPETRFGIVDGSLIENRTTDGNIGFIQPNVLEMDGFLPMYAIRAKTPNGQFTNAYIITSNKQVYEKIHFRIYGN